MYMALYETRYIEESWTLSASWHGLCSCGRKFPLDNNEIAVSWFRPDSRTSMKPCPYCGAPYGNQALRIDMRNWQYGHTNLEVKDIKDKVALFSLSREGDIVTLDREVVAEKEFTTSHFSVASTSRIQFDIGRGLRIEDVEINGKQVKINASNLTKALSRCLTPNLPVEPEFKPFVDEMKVFGKAICTQSVAVICKNLLKYPVLDTLYHQADPDRMAYMQSVIERSIRDDVLAEGERSVKKGLGIPQAMLPYVTGLRLYLKDAQQLIQEFGSDVSLAAAKIASEVLEENSTIYELTSFLARRTPAERIRLKTYLTEETDLYQGIESHKAAWELLRDYISMSEEMKVPYQLCPKSLKLQHDLTTRNYKLVLSELERVKFAEVVSKPEYKRLAWKSQDGKWAVLVPAEANDLVLEGKKQSHCVGSYVGRVMDGRNKICFLRRTEDLDKPVLTLSVNPENICTTYLGFDNRNATMEEYAALEEWAQTVKLKIEGRKVA